MQKQIDILKTADTNVVFGEGQPEYLPLPAHKVPADPQGRVIITYGLSWRQRLQVLIFGRLWVSVLTFGSPFQPLMVCSYNFTGECYLPHDVVATEQGLSRLRIDQKCTFKGVICFIRGFYGYSGLILANEQCAELRADKCELQYFVDDLVNGKISE